MAPNAGKILLRGKGRLKMKGNSIATSDFGKYLNIPEPPQADIPKLINSFIRLHNGHNRGLKKEGYPLDKLKSFLSGKDRIGTGDIAKLLSQFTFKRF